MRKKNPTTSNNGKGKTTATTMKEPAAKGKTTTATSKEPASNGKTTATVTATSKKLNPNGKTTVPSNVPAGKGKITTTTKRFATRGKTSAIFKVLASSNGNPPSSAPTSPAPAPAAAAPDENNNAQPETQPQPQVVQQSPADSSSSQRAMATTSPAGNITTRRMSIVSGGKHVKQLVRFRTSGTITASVKQLQSKKEAAAAGKKHRKKNFTHFGIYLHQVLTNVQPQLRISNRAMSIMNSLMHDIFERLASESSRLSAISKSRTLMARDIQTAVRLHLPGELGSYAVSDGTKAVAKYMASRGRFVY